MLIAQLCLRYVELPSTFRTGHGACLTLHLYIIIGSNDLKIKSFIITIDYLFLLHYYLLSAVLHITINNNIPVIKDLNCNLFYFRVSRHLFFLLMVIKSMVISFDHTEQSMYFFVYDYGNASALCSDR